MRASTRGHVASFARAAAPLVFVALIVTVLLRFPPTQYSFYPQCPIYSMFHLQCPGCGTTRALAALLHGHLGTALRLNALTTLMLPVTMAYAALCYRRYLHGYLRGQVRAVPFRWPHLPPIGIYTALAIATLFAILRNLPAGSL
ncbi:MAG: DUF2752 domain-containing protein [Edaphobacter sp.]